MKSYLIRSITALILITSSLYGCAGILGNKVKLSEVPEMKSKGVNSLSLSYYFENKDSSTNKCEEGLECDFNRRFVDLFSSKNYGVEPLGVANPNGCTIKISSKNDVKGLILAPYALVSALTLFLIPFYIPLDYQATATLIYYPSESYLKDKAINILPDQINLNKTQIKQSKTKNKGVVTITNYLITQSGQKINEGDYFLDENNRLTKLLKAYELKDKVHEVWSSLWMLSWFVVNPNKYAPNAEYPNDAKKIMEDKISEALTRSILNDASQFKECQKDQPSSSNKK